MIPGIRFYSHRKSSERSIPNTKRWKFLDVCNQSYVMYNCSGGKGCGLPGYVALKSNETTSIFCSKPKQHLFSAKRLPNYLNQFQYALKFEVQMSQHTTRSFSGCTIIGTKFYE